MSTLRKALRILLVSVVLFIGILFSDSALDNSLKNQAMAKPMTPEAAQYEIDQANSPEEAANKIKNEAQAYKKELDDDTHYTNQAVKRVAKETQNNLNQTANRLGEKTREASDRASDASDNLVDNTQSKLKELGDTVRERLNLDEPIPQSTRDFLGDVEQRVDQTVDPIIGNNPGYYKVDRR